MRDYTTEINGRRTEHHPVALHLDSPENVFFTSDTHFGDEKAMRLSGRPFSSVQEMDDELILRWNETVPEDSMVFHLGGFGFGKYMRGIDILHSLSGRIYLVLGNHDQQTLCRGHVHSGPLSGGADLARMKYLFPTQYDVGVDNNGFRPISFFDVQAIINEQKKAFRKRYLDRLAIL